MSTRNTVSEVPKIETKQPESTNIVSFSALSDFAASNVAKNYSQMGDNNANSSSEVTDVDSLIAKSKIDISS